MKLRTIIRAAVPGVALLGATALLQPIDFAAAKSKEDKKVKESDEEEVDYIALAAKLLKDGHHDRASAMLDKVDTKKEGLDLVRYHTLRGIVGLNLKLYKQARTSFLAAIQAGQKEKTVHLFLAQAYYGEKDFAQVVKQLDKAGKAGKASVTLFQMRAQAHWELKQYDQSIGTLTEGVGKFPKDSELIRIKLFRLVELDLYQESLLLGQDLLSRETATVDDYLAIGQALRQGKQFNEARRILQTARFKYPENTDATLQLAHTYIDDDKPFTAAMLYEEASRLEPEHRLETAELYKQAKRLDRALFVNAQVADQKLKMKQRLSILLELERFEQIAAMKGRLSRLGLLSDQNIRYALAYAEFKIGSFEKSEAHLKQIHDATLFDASLQLRKAMEDCKSAGWECF